MVEIPPIERVSVDALTTDGKNPNKMTSQKLEALKENLRKFGFLIPIITNKNLVIADGEHRLKAAKNLGMTDVPIIRLDVDEIDRRILRQVLNKLRGEHSTSLDAAEFSFLLDNNKLDALSALLGQNKFEKSMMLAQIERLNFGKGDLASDFIIPPFSVLEASSADWQDRKKFWSCWLADPGATREGVLKYSSATVINKNVSVFDPVLAEICYKWFNIPAGRVLDPFGGGSTRGLIAGLLKYPYYARNKSKPRKRTRRTSGLN